MKLYSGPLSMFGAKTEIAVREKGVAADVEHVPFALTTLYEPKHPDVARINPKQQVPVLIDGDLELFDSTQIFEYLEDLKPDPPLWPRDRHARARARLLELESDEVFFPNVLGEPIPVEHARVRAWRARGRGRESVRQVVGTMVRFLEKQGLSVAAL
jgi:glutathione S-transferase